MTSCPPNLTLAAALPCRAVSRPRPSSFVYLSLSTPDQLSHQQLRLCGSQCLLLLFPSIDSSRLPPMSATAPSEAPNSTTMRRLSNGTRPSSARC